MWRFWVHRLLVHPLQRCQLGVYLIAKDGAVVAHPMCFTTDEHSGWLPGMTLPVACTALRVFERGEADDHDYSYAKGLAILDWRERDRYATRRRLTSRGYAALTKGAKARG